MATKIDGCDNLVVKDFHVVPDGTTARMIVSGTGAPRPILLDFSRDLVFRVAGSMLAICDRIDHGQMVAVLRAVASSMGMTLSDASASAVPVVVSEVSPLGVGTVAVPGAPRVDDGMARLAESFVERAARATESLVDLGQVLLAISDRTMSKEESAMIGVDAPSPPWRVSVSSAGSEEVEVDVDLVKGVVVMLQPDSLVPMTPAESALLGSVLRAASAFVQRALSSPAGSVRAQAPALSAPADVGSMGTGR